MVDNTVAVITLGDVYHNQCTFGVTAYRTRNSRALLRKRNTAQRTEKHEQK
jgi:hypothetical protein